MSEKKKTSTRMPRLRTMELMFKPIFDVHLNMAIDFYARMQMNDRSMGIMLPEVYVPVAEKSNQICELGKWALEEACDVMKRCEEREADVNSIVLWTSTKHIKKKSFVTHAVKTVTDKGINPDRICFMITDNIYQADSEQISENFKALREYGFLIAIDDFGMEYSSLPNLGQYEVDYIGIHESLIQDILTNERTQNMIQGIIDFAKKLQSGVMVGGIDSEEKAELLKKMGVDRLSGSYYGDYMNEKKIG